MNEIDPSIWADIGKQLEEDGCTKQVRSDLCYAIQQKEKFWTMIDNEKMYHYNGGTYDNTGEQVIKKILRTRFGTQIKKRNISEIIDTIRYKDKNLKKRPQTTDYPFLLPVKNGALNLETEELQDYSQKYFFTNKIPVKYDPDAEPSKIAEFMYDICDTQAKVRTLMEFVGTTLVRKLPIQKAALMLVGEGANGKSTFFDLVKKLLGSKNFATTSLKQLCDNRFAIADLYGKRAVLNADLNYKDIYDTGPFKRVTGKDAQIRAERKYENKFQFTPYAPLFFAANKIPKTKRDKTMAFYRRWCIIELPYKFVENPQGDFEKQKDSNILEKITQPRELSGFLNAAIEGLHRVQENNRLTIHQEWEQVKEIYEKKSDQYSTFVKQVLVEVPNVVIPRSKIYNVYTNWVQGVNFNRKAKNIFNRKLQEYVNAEMCRPQIQGKRKRCWKGIYLNYRYFQERIPKKHIRGNQTEL